MLLQYFIFWTNTVVAEAEGSALLTKNPDMGMILSQL
jgi:hypothetical protein